MAGTSEGHQTYYVPEQTKLPFFATVFLAATVLGGGTLMNNSTYNADNPSGLTWLLPVGAVLFIMVLWTWFSATIRENLAGLNSPQLKKSYVLGMQWFIFSEVMFFFAFFFALAYVRMWVVPWLGGEGDKGAASMLWQGFSPEWPVMTTPQQAVNAAGAVMPTATAGEFTGFKHAVPWNEIPLINTLLLVASSVTVHFAHTALKSNNRKGLTMWMIITLVLGFTFVGFQAYEYYHAYHELGLTLESGIYGSTFFLLTGFHGFHVCMGAVMLTVMFLRAQTANHFTPDDHFGFEAASWYWHFVDVVWLFLFAFVYVVYQG